MRTGGDECVSVFEFDNEGAIQNLKIKIFDKPSEEWANFVMMNRNENISQPSHDYDIVIGPIADDSVVMSFRLFNNGYITISELVKRLEYRELSTQYFFHNEKALDPVSQNLLMSGQRILEEISFISEGVKSSS
jgi:hypothetical protein